MSYTDQLTPKQVRHLLFEIGALQPDQYKWSIPDTEITLCPDETPILISGRIYLNTVTGLWTSSNDGSGDVIGLIGLRFGHSNTAAIKRSEEHTSELQSRFDLVCRLLLEKKNSHKLN